MKEKSTVQIMDWIVIKYSDEKEPIVRMAKEIKTHDPFMRDRPKFSIEDE